MEFRSVCCEIYIDCKEREGLITASDDEIMMMMMMMMCVLYI